MSLYSILLAGIITFAAPDEACMEHQISPFYPTMSLRYSTPIKLSGVLGFAIKRAGDSSLHNDIFFSAEPGFGGGKLSIGRRIGNIHSTPFWLVGLSGSLMQTWGNPLSGVQPGQTYVGMELSGSTYFIILSGGVYRHIIGDDSENDWVYCLGAGVGI